MVNNDQQSIWLFSTQFNNCTSGPADKFKLVCNEAAVSSIACSLFDRADNLQLRVLLRRSSSIACQPVAAASEVHRGERVIVARSALLEADRRLMDSKACSVGVRKPVQRTSAEWG